MKKFIVILITLLVVGSYLMAHEVSFYYTSQAHQRYWHFNDMRLCWKGDNYVTSFGLKNLTDPNPQLVINQAWASIDLFETFYSYFQKYPWIIGKISFGKMYYDFGAFPKTPSKQISIHTPYQYFQDKFASDLMVKLSVDWCSAHYFSFYWADMGINNGTADWPSTVGFRAMTTYVENLRLGASIRVREAFGNKWKSWKDKNYKWDYGLDVCYLLDNMVKFDIQAYTLDDNDKFTDDIYLWGIVTYEKGFMAPYVKLIKPYIGYFSKNEMKDFNVIAGLDMKPMESAFVKLEYNYDSLGDKKTDPNYDFPFGNAITLEFGFIF